MRASPRRCCSPRERTWSKQDQSDLSNEKQHSHPIKNFKRKAEVSANGALTCSHSTSLSQPSFVASPRWCPVPSSPSSVHTSVAIIAELIYSKTCSRQWFVCCILSLPNQTGNVLTCRGIRVSQIREVVIVALRQQQWRCQQRCSTSEGKC